MTDSLTPLAAFLGGTLTLLAPCSVMLLPAFFAYAFASRTTLLMRTGLFWLGLVTTLVPLGAAAGSLGAVLRSHSGTLTVVVAVVVMTLGLLQALEVEVPRPHLPGFLMHGDARDSASPLSIYLLGAVYGLAGVGCAGPILGAVLAMAGMGGSPFGAAALMVLYAAGMALPLALAALVWEGLDLSSRAWLRPRTVHVLGRRTTWTSLLSGTLFVALGVVLLMSGPAGPLGGVVDAGAMARLEVAVMEAAQRVPWWTVVGVVASLVAAAAVARHTPH